MKVGGASIRKLGVDIAKKVGCVAEKVMMSKKEEYQKLMDEIKLLESEL